MNTNPTEKMDRPITLAEDATDAQTRSINTFYEVLQATEVGVESLEVSADAVRLTYDCDKEEPCSVAFAAFSLWFRRTNSEWYPETLYLTRRTDSKIIQHVAKPEWVPPDLENEVTHKQALSYVLSTEQVRSR